jgi:tRNA-splicing ligase RtcB
MIHYKGDKVPIKAWIGNMEIEEEAMKQLHNVSRMPFIYKHIAVMPDVHAGMGATIGSVIPTKDAIIPAAVGVDIGCGMRATKLNCTVSDIDVPYASLRMAIEKAVPHGRTNNGGKGDRGAWGHITDQINSYWNASCRPIDYDYLCGKYPELKKANSVNHLGTLGTGNHFIELAADKEDYLWLIIHSGSRGIGNKIGTYFIRKAKEECAKWFVELPDPNLAYFPMDTEYFADYMMGVQWAQNFAKQNRAVMWTNVLKPLDTLLGKLEVLEDIDCHHNYVQKENHFGNNVWVTRKGAVRARQGDMGIIPGSMGERSFIVRGLGNKDSFTSCSHGAGRKMSRTAARKSFTVEQHRAATEGIECKKDDSVLDETPAAYKDIDAVMAAQTDLVEVVYTLKQFVCVKG